MKIHRLCLGGELNLGWRHYCQEIHGTAVTKWLAPADEIKSAVLLCCALNSRFNCPTLQRKTYICVYNMVGRGSVVGIATRYGPGIESRWGRDFPHLSRPALAPTQPPVQWVPGHISRGKAAEAWRQPPTPCKAPKFTKEQGYTFTPPLGLHGLL